MPSYNDLNYDYQGGHISINEMQVTSLEGCPQVIDGALFCSSNELRNLIGGPRQVSNRYDCAFNKLTSLEGCPDTITGDFFCNDNNLVSLSPLHNISGIFDCSYNKLTSLVGGPKLVKTLICKNNGIINLEGCPDVLYSFIIGFNNLKSLVGGPDMISGNYDCSYNQLTDLVGCASHIGNILYCSSNPITSLMGIHKIIKSCKGFVFDYEKITHGGIGLLLIDNLTKISNYNGPFQIIQKYLGTGTKGMMACRAELIAKGYENYAKL